MRRRLLFILLFVCRNVVGGRYALPSSRGKGDLPAGWGGEKALARREAVAALNKPAPVFLSWSPRIVLVREFLTEEECAHIIGLARASMARSSVVDAQSGGSVVDSIRTSSGTFLQNDADKVMKAVTQRIAELSMVPRENQESLQVLHYGRDERYGAHMDTFSDTRHITPENGLQRVATALMFLNSPEEGGETVFPNVAAENTGPGWSACARHALAHKPQTGDLILFWSLDAAGEVDMGTTHTACPVLKGEKWSAPLWIRQSAFQPKSHPNAVSGDSCDDTHKSCRAWAAEGECDKNRNFMMSACKRACNACPYPATH